MEKDRVERKIIEKEDGSHDIEIRIPTFELKLNINSEGEQRT